MCDLDCCFVDPYFVRPLTPVSTLISVPRVYSRPSLFSPFASVFGTPMSSRVGPVYRNHHYNACAPRPTLTLHGRVVPGQAHMRHHGFHNRVCSRF